MTPRPSAPGPTTGFLVLAGALTAFASVTTDIYLPALPALTRSLGGTTAQGQATLAASFVGLAAGQLFYGPCSDRLGRRPALMIGVGVYIAASIACALAGSIGAMIGLRLAQALGACAGVVIAGAVVRDRYDHQSSAGVLSFMLLARGVGPILAALVGGVIVTLIGWRAIFWALALFGAGVGTWAFLRLPETRSRETAERARGETPFRAYGAVLRNGRAVGYVLTNAFNFAGMLAWVAAAPYLVIGAWHVPPLYLGWILGLNGAGFMAASQVNRLLLRRHPADLILRWGAAGAAAAAAVLLADTATGLGGPLGIMVPLFFAVASLGFVSTNAMAGALAADPSRAGTVSALLGVGQYAMGGLAAVAGGLISPEPARGMAGVIFICAVEAAVFPLLGLGRPSPGLTRRAAPVRASLPARPARS